MEILYQEILAIQILCLLILILYYAPTYKGYPCLILPKHTTPNLAEPRSTASHPTIPRPQIY